jgi:hypothetical protein
MPLTFEESGALTFGESEFSSSEFGRRLGID